MYVIAFFVTAGPVTVCGDVKFEVPPLRDFNIYVMRLKERLSRRFTSRRLRYLALTSHEQVQLRDIKKTLIFIAYLKNEAVEEGDHDTVANLQDLHDIFAAKYILIKYSPLDDIALEYLPDYRRTIDSFDDSQCDLQFRFKKDHLHLLLKLLRFPDVISFDNRAKMFGEEVFLRGLYELRSGDTQYDCSTNLFGRDFTAQSRAYGWFVKHIYYNFRDLITGNLEWWFRNGFVNESREAIWRKMTAVSHNKINYLYLI